MWGMIRNKNKVKQRQDQLQNQMQSQWQKLYSFPASSPPLTIIMSTFVLYIHMPNSYAQQHQHGLLHRTIQKDLGGQSHTHHIVLVCVKRETREERG